MAYLSSVEVVQGIRTGLAQHGVDAAAAFTRAGLDDGACGADDALALSDKLSHLWELLEQESGDPLLGLKLAAPALDSLGLMDHILQMSPDLGSAVENLVRYTPLVSPTVHANIERAHGRTRVSLLLPRGQRTVPRQRYDFVWYLALCALRRAAGRSGLRPALLSYDYPAPDALQAYVDLFGCPVRFGAAHNAMEFHDSDLTAPIPGARPLGADWALRMLAELAQSQRDWTLRMLARLDDGDGSGNATHEGVSERVQALLADMLANGEPLREDVARRLAMSERTLQRRLAEEGTSFSRLVDDTRRELARRQLGSGQVSLKRLSFELGFSDPSAFCRACKRWFGRPPTQLQ